MAIAIDSSGNAVASGGSFSTTDANTVVFFSYDANTATVQSPTFTNGSGTPAIVTSVVQNGSESVYLQTFSIVFTASGSHTATLPNLAQNGRWVAYTGVNTTTPFGQNTSGHNVITLSLTGLTANSWVVCNWDGSITNCDLGSGPTTLRVGTGHDQSIADSNGTISGDQTQNWTSVSGLTALNFFEVLVAAGAATTTATHNSTLMGVGQ